MSWSVGWPAPAKLNLFLHITGRRPDGYHALQTVFQLLDVGDELDFAVTQDGSIRLTCDVPELSGDDNLVVKAARCLQRKAGETRGAEIRLRKRLPAGGGVGGGSSDAATTLLALNALWRCDVELEMLAELGRSLGADVPVFVRGHSAFAEGIGDEITPISLPNRHYLVLHANVAVATAPLFQAQELTRDCLPIKMADFVGDSGSNVFEPLVRERYPDIDHGMRWLEEQRAVGTCRLTGTGGCFFAAFADKETPLAVLAEAPYPLTGFVAQGVARSPAHNRLQLHGVR